MVLGGVIVAVQFHIAALFFYHNKTFAMSFFTPFVAHQFNPGA